MTELLKNAWLGWQGFITEGKLVALLAASLLYFWLFYKRREHRALLVYTTVLTICCVLPVTAAGLMLYQTKFYDYQWIWSLVPMTAVTAWGAVTILMEHWGNLKAAEWKRGVPVLALLLAVLLLSGGVRKPVDKEADAERGAAERGAAERVLAQAAAEMPGETVCLWAPQAVMEYARETDAAVTLLYGRNMWDIWLDAYSYDAYPEEIKELYQWMEKVEEGNREKEVETQVKLALEEGANCILLPGNLDEKRMYRLEDRLDIRIVELEDYYLLIA